MEAKKITITPYQDIPPGREPNSKTTKLSTYTPMSTPPEFTWPASSLPNKKSHTLSDSKLPRETQNEEEIDYLKLILNARVYDVANETPLTFAAKVKKKIGIIFVLIMY